MSMVDEGQTWYGRVVWDGLRIEMIHGTAVGEPWGEEPGVLFTFGFIISDNPYPIRFMPWVGV